MWPGVQAVAASGVLIAHTSLVPAGAGVVAALVQGSPQARLAPGTTGAGHDPRVRELRARAALDQLGTVQAGHHQGGPAAPAAPSGPAVSPSHPGTAVLFGLAAVCAADSAVVQAVAASHQGAAHRLIGVLLSLSAVVQFAWATLALLLPHRRLLHHGAWINLLLVAVWGLSRTVGLPPVLDGAEPMGLWGLSAMLWQVGALVCCLTAMAPASLYPGRIGTRRLVWAAGVASVVALVALGVTGPPA